MQKNVPDHAPEDLIGRYTVPKEGGGKTTRRRLPKVAPITS